MSTPRIRLGKWGEGVAGRFLQEKGYLLLDANYRCRWGEVDIVAQEGDELVFVEVRTRRGVQYGTPEESVTAAKARRLIATAQDYLQQHGQEESDWRIDLIAISVGNQQKWDTLVKERSGGCGSIVGLPALPVVAFAPL